MAAPWTADVEIPRELAASLIRSQFPRFADSHISLLSEGWDNAAFLVDGRFVFRFPRRKIAANLLEREAKILPLLQPHLSLRIPAPEFVGSPFNEYPWVFSGYPRIHGVTADRIPLNNTERCRLADPLGSFLAALHRIPVDKDTVSWAPDDELRRADIPFRAPKVIERLNGIRDSVGSAQVEAAIELGHKIAASPIPDSEHPTPATRWVHGDLYARHLILDDSRNLAGVIDWGDVHLGDPAIDLSIIFSFLPAAARDRFRESYGEATDFGVWERARFRAIHYAPILIEYGRSIADSAMEDAGRTALRFALQE